MIWTGQLGKANDFLLESVENICQNPVGLEN
jgi:hypothetical protein